MKYPCVYKPHLSTAHTVHQTGKQGQPPQKPTGTHSQTHTHTHTHTNRQANTNTHAYTPHAHTQTDRQTQTHMHIGNNQFVSTQNLLILYIWAAERLLGIPFQMPDLMKATLGKKNVWVSSVKPVISASRCEPP